MMNIGVQRVSKKFGSFVALEDVSLDIQSGELMALLGPSGSGKTTLLRIIAGLEQPDDGKVLFDGEDASRRDLRTRGVGFVFQHYALFRHMTVAENVAFGLQVKPRKQRLPKEGIRQKVLELLRLVHLEPLANRLPRELSGGQRQRVALARALAVEPQVLLLDEPFGALDANVRQELRRWLRSLHDQLHVTSVLVTHDQQEALEVADRVLVMNEGAVEQVGTPEQIREHPASAFVMNFVGTVNAFPGHVHEGVAHLGRLRVAVPDQARARGVAATGFARPHELEVQRVAEDNGMWATLGRIHVYGKSVRLELDGEDGRKLEVETTREYFEELRPQPGESLYVRPRHLRVFLDK